jgi:uncharacterized protein (TIGR03437 family)
MKRPVCTLALALAAAGAAFADIKLPASGLLAGPLDDAQSLMGDEISNYPFGKGVGSVPIHGWVQIEFAAPVDRVAKFRLTWRALGDVPFFSFASGHYLTVRAEANFNSAVQNSGGELDLVTGEVRNFELHAVLENILIQKSSRYNRLPILSKGDGFSALFVDYPAPEYPFSIPYSDRPSRLFLEPKFVLDANQQIRGFAFRGTSFIPITLFPKLGLMPPYAFARNGVTLIPGVDGCLPGTTPENQCISEARYPDGVDSPDNAFLGPSLYLVSDELREVPRTRALPAAMSVGVSGAAAAALSGRLYLVGGYDGRETLARTAAFDPARGEWTALPDAPRPSYEACALAAGGRVYRIGGRERPDGAPLASVDVLDPAARSWSASTPLPAALTRAGCAEVDGRVYVFGGQTQQADGAWITSDLAWTLEGGVWRALGRMPLPLAGAAVATVRGEIYVAGGSTDGKTASTSLIIYSPAAGAWRNGPAIPRGVVGASAAYLDGRLYVAGGRVAPEGALDTGTVIYQSQTLQVLVGDKWHAGLYPPVAVAEAAGAVVGDTWYVAGGDVSAPARAAGPIGAVQAFQAQAGWVVSASTPVLTAASVRNAASLAVGPAELAPGALASIFGYHLSAKTVTAPAARYAGRYFTTDLPETLGEVRVTVDGQTAGLVAVSPERVDFQVPFSVTAGRRVSLQVGRGGVAAPAVEVAIAPAAPGVFTYDYGEALAIDVLDEAAAIATNANGRLNYPSQPARRGELISLVCTGLGQVEPRLEPLQRAGRDRVSVPVLVPEVLIDGKIAAVESARLLPGEAGLYEVRVRIPLDARTGPRVPLVMRSGQISSNRTVIVIE